MSYKSILVCPNDIKNTRQLTKVACEIANHSPDARVLGAHWITRVHEFSHGERVPGTWTNKFDLPLDRLVHAMSTEFYQETEKKSFPCEWVSINAEPNQQTSVLVEYAQCADIVINSAAQDSEPLTSALVMHSGRPILVIPEEYLPKPEYAEIIIAWNGTRASARAAFDALPFLKRANKVEIVWIDQPENPDQVVNFLIKEFSVALALHKVNAVVNRITPSVGARMDISDIIVDRAKEFSADLIVAGAFGKTGASTDELGSVSAKLMSLSPIPVLLSV